MSKPDIPQDVWQAAETAFDLMLCNCIEASGTPEQFRIDSIEPHARAILAERERCAAQLEAMAEESDGQPRWAIFHEAVTAIRGGTAPIDAAATQSDGGGE